MTTHVPALIVGAGISGLVCAYALRKSGMDVLVVEASPRPGGLIRSERRDGYLLELGPQSFSSTVQLLNLCRDLGIQDQLVEAPPRAPRYLLIDSQLRPVPLSAPAFFISSLFSAKTKWSLVSDVFRHTTPPTSDESIADFTRRRFSAELLDKLVGPFVSGVYAGDAEKLSLRAAFPQLHEAERSAGSIIWGMLRAAKAKSKAASENGAAPAKKHRPTLQTFRDGNETLVKALAASLDPAVRTETSVRDIRRSTSAQSTSYEVTLTAKNSSQQITADNLILAASTDVAADLLRTLSPDISASLKPIEYAPIAVVSLGYPQSAIQHSLEGFGFLVPRSAGRRTLGTVWNSSLFPNRTPDGHVLLTSFVGGATDPTAISQPEAELAAVVHSELTPILEIQSSPAFSSVTLYRRALPQYNLGHSERLAAIQRLSAALPGLFLTGNYLRGPAIGSCVEQALAIAEAVLVRSKQPAANAVLAGGSR